jgi:5-oxoprolinase (ATP-hydrolysing) subunit A
MGMMNQYFIPRPLSCIMLIDLNCDCGESYGVWTLGDDAAILPHVTSANVACGAHAGDPLVMRRTVRLAREQGVAVGAHPGYPDRDGFGRRVLPLAPDEIAATLLAQIGALAAIAKAEGVALTHVKLHGALYNHAAVTPVVAQAIAAAVAGYDSRLMLVGLAGSALIDAGRAAGLRVAREAFADRSYEADGTLRSRALPGAVLDAPQAALAQALAIVGGTLRAHDGSALTIVADTICLHGDLPGAAERARVVRDGLIAAGVRVAPLAVVLAAPSEP